MNSNKRHDIHLPFRAGALSAALLLSAAVPPAWADMALAFGPGSARVDGGDFEGSDTGWKGSISGHGRFVGGELGYVDFGELGSNGPSARAWAPAVTAGLPLGQAANLYGKFGVAFADVEGDSLREEYSDEKPFYGAGLRFGADGGLGLRLEYERYQLEREDVDLASLGLEFRFR